MNKNQPCSKSITFPKLTNSKPPQARQGSFSLFNPANTTASAKTPTTKRKSEEVVIPQDLKRFKVANLIISTPPEASVEPVATDTMATDTMATEPVITDSVHEIINSQRRLTSEMKDFLITTKAQIRCGAIKNRSLNKLFYERFPQSTISTNRLHSYIYNHKFQIQHNLPESNRSANIQNIELQKDLTPEMRQFLLTTKAKLNLGKIKDTPLDFLFHERFPNFNLTNTCAHNFMYNHKFQIHQEEIVLNGGTRGPNLIEINSSRNLTNPMKKFILITKAQINRGEIKGKPLGVLFKEKYPEYHLNATCLNNFVRHYKWAIQKEENILAGISAKDTLIEINSARDLSPAMRTFLITTKAELKFSGIKDKSLCTLFQEKFPEYRLNPACAQHFVNHYKYKVAEEYNKLAGISSDTKLTQINSTQFLTPVMRKFLIKTKAQLNCRQITNQSLEALFNQNFPNFRINVNCLSSFIYNNRQNIAAEAKLLAKP